MKYLGLRFVGAQRVKQVCGGYRMNIHGSILKHVKGPTGRENVWGSIPLHSECFAHLRASEGV